MTYDSVALIFRIHTACVCPLLYMHSEMIIIKWSDRVDFTLIEYMWSLIDSDSMRGKLTVNSFTVFMNMGLVCISENCRWLRV